MAEEFQGFGSGKNKERGGGMNKMLCKKEEVESKKKA